MVRGWLGAQHHSSEVAELSRKKQPGSKTLVVDGRAVAIIPIESIRTADDAQPTFKQVTAWLRDSRATVTFDRFAFDVQFADVAYATDTHTGDDWLGAARSQPAMVRVANGFDPRRTQLDAIDAAADAGNVASGLADAFLSLIHI